MVLVSVRSEEMLGMSHRFLDAKYEGPSSSESRSSISSGSDVFTRELALDQSWLSSLGSLTNLPPSVADRPINASNDPILSKYLMRDAASASRLVSRSAPGSYMGNRTGEAADELRTPHTEGSEQSEIAVHSGSGVETSVGNIDYLSGMSASPTFSVNDNDWLLDQGSTDGSPTLLTTTTNPSMDTSNHCWVPPAAVSDPIPEMTGTQTKQRTHRSSRRRPSVLPGATCHASLASTSSAVHLGGGSVLTPQRQLPAMSSDTTVLDAAARSAMALTSSFAFPPYYNFPPAPAMPLVPFPMALPYTSDCMTNSLLQNPLLAHQAAGLMMPSASLNCSLLGSLACSSPGFYQINSGFSLGAMPDLAAASAANFMLVSPGSGIPKNYGVVSNCISGGGGGVDATASHVATTSVLSEATRYVCDSTDQQDYNGVSSMRALQLSVDMIKSWEKELKEATKTAAQALSNVSSLVRRKRPPASYGLNGAKSRHVERSPVETQTGRPQKMNTTVVKTAEVSRSLARSHPPSRARPRRFLVRRDRLRKNVCKQ